MMGVLTHHGLTTEEASRRLEQYGKNILPETKGPGIMLVFIRQFKNPFIYVLLVAAFVSFGLEHTVNAYFIIAVLLINAIIGTFQEYSAEMAASALQKMVPFYASVYRDGKPVKINTTDVVPGDWVQIVAGDKIPADLKLESIQDLQVDESTLTGESVASAKKEYSGTTDEVLNIERTDMCFSGTVVMRGRGAGEVIATGANTEIGKIATDVGVDKVKPPLLLRMEQFTLLITYGIIILIGLIFVITISRDESLVTVFLLSVALAVSAIPEGLPVAITVALAIGMRRMAHSNVIIRKLVAVESLGSCTCIASDKTGTLTVNEMTIRRIVLPDDTAFSVTGEGMDLHGELISDDSRQNLDRLKLLVTSGVLANEATLERHSDGWVGYGDRVDVAFLVMAEKYGLASEEARTHYSEISNVPYESENSYSASLNRYNNKYCIFVKGSVERLLEMSEHTESSSVIDKEAITQQSVFMASQGYRVLGMAYVVIDEVPTDLQSAIKNLVFLGIVGMLDPIRPDVVEAVQQCNTAKIKVVMVTGDHPQTALAVARQAGIADEGIQPVTGYDLREAEQQGDNAFEKLVLGSTVFARVHPHQKKQIVETLIGDGEFVAVTGDGVNDAPALSHAHVGISMGKRGTDVARESSDLIITDDHFSSIVEGIKQGRVVYNNIRKVIFLLISTGAAEITLMLLSLMMSTPLPLFPIQLLWLNLVTNGIQDVALAFEPEEGRELKQSPRSPKESVFNRLMIERVIMNAIVMGCLAFAVFKWQLDQGYSEYEARNITLLLMVLFENVHVLNSRSETISIFLQNLFGNKLLIFGMLGAQTIHIAALYTPGFREVLQVQPVTLEQWLVLLGIAMMLIVVNEIYKYWYSIRYKVTV